MSLNNVNVAMVENNTIVKTDVLRAEKAGTAVKIKAVKGAKYILAEGEKGYAPENITVKRVGKDLHVMLEGTDENQPQLIIEDFFTNPGELVGKAEDGQWHEFISSDGDGDHEAAFLMDGESSALVLGAGAIGALDGLAVAPFALSPALMALGALAGILAAAGLATAIAHNRDNGGDHGGSDGGDGGGGGIGPVIKAPVWSEVVDDHGDFQGPIQNGGLTDDNTPTFGGTGTPGNTIIIRDKGEVIGSTIVGEDGSWTWTPENPLPDGEHNITPVERDEHGNESVPGEEFVVIIDTDPPARPEIGQVFDDVEPKMGPVANGGYTNDDTPTFSGEGQTPGDTIIIIDNGKEIGSVIVGEDGSWSFTPDEPLKDGDHSIEVVARDPAGNRSEPSDPWLVIVDTEIPGKPGTGTTGGLDDIIDDVGPVTGSIAKGGVTDDTTPTLEGSYQRPGTIVTIIDNGEVIGSTVADANGGWRFTPAELPQGDHNFSIIIETPTGYVSPESDPWLVVIDLDAPEAPVIKEIIDDQGAVTGPINNGDVTDDAQPKISGTAEAGSTVIVYDKGVEIGRVQADDEGNWSFTPVPPLQNGNHEISAKAQDLAGNIGEASNSIGFELIAGGNATAPSIVGAWDDVEAYIGLLQSGAKTNDASPELRGTAPAGDTVTIIMDGKVQGTVIADGQGNWSWTPAADIPDGTHNFRAETHDDAGNPAATGNFQLVIDTDAPDAATGIVADDNVGPVVGPIGDGDTTDDSTPTIGGEGEPGGTVIIKDGDDVIGSTIVGDDGHWEFTPETPLPDGEHDIIVVIRDEAGNESAPSDPIHLIVDTGDVVISIDYAYDDVEANTGNLASGSVTNDDTPTLHGKATANSIVTIMNGDVVIGSVKTDSFGRWSFTTPALQDGHYGFTATATDAKTGAVSAPTAEFALDIDTQAPTKPGEGGTGGDGIGDIIDDVGPIRGSVKPGDVTDDTTPTLEGSGLQPGDVVSIIDNGEVIGSTVADENGGWQFTPNPPLNQGEHEFTIIVTDPAGNRSEPSDPYLIVVDTDAPVAPVIKEIIDDQGAVTGPINNGDVTDDAQPKISGTAEVGSTVIVYDKGVEIGRVQADDAGNWAFTPVPPLLNGDHEISAKAQDLAGNIGEASNSIGFEL
uniref:Ig-like domain-containing protein n=1 Tax=Pantoea sp. CTOTU49201 TaxID=2953855 RepID=UPI0028970AA5